MVDTSYIRSIICSLSEEGVLLEENLFSMMSKCGIDIDVDYGRDLLIDLVLEEVISHNGNGNYTLTPKGESMVDVLKCGELLIILRLTGANRSVKVFCNRVLEIQGNSPR